MQLDGARIYIAGHAGLVGGAVSRAMSARGLSPITRTRKLLDLTDQAQTENFFQSQKPDVVILCAARVGGIMDNSRNQAAMLHDNLAIAHNVIASAARAGCKRLVFLGSSCIYPRMAPQPITEDALLTGPLEPTNRGYAVAKIAGMEMARAYAEAGLLATVSLQPTNLYGPGDNFDPERSHVLPALIRKFHDAKAAGEKRVTLWGSGTPLRELLHVDDLARAVMMVLDKDPGPAPINVGSGQEHTIRQLAELAAAAVGWQGEIVFDTSKPDGTPRKLLDSSRMHALGWAPEIALQDGIRQTYEWFRTSWREGARATTATSVTTTTAPRPTIVQKPVSPPPPLITAVTSLSPDPARRSHQLECVESWRAAGCEVVAIGTADEAAQFSNVPGLRFVTVEGSSAHGGRFVPISRITRWIASDDRASRGHILLINSDCRLVLSASQLRDLVRQTASGLCYLVRHDVDGNGAETRCNWGIDGYLFAGGMADVFPDSEILCMGKPYWDWVMPTVILQAGFNLFCPMYRVMLHRNHPQRWSESDYDIACNEAGRLTGITGPPMYHHFASKTRFLPDPPLPAARPYTAPAPTAHDTLPAASSMPNDRRRRYAHRGLV